MLALGWFLAEPYFYWNRVISLLILANGAASVAWLAGFWFIGSSQSTHVYRVQDEVADECAKGTLDTCASILHEREALFRKLAARDSAALDAAIRNALRQTPISELESALLEKWKGACFVESESRDLQIFFAAERCDRCKTALRSSEVRRLAIAPLRAQAAGLERRGAVPPRAMRLRFEGDDMQLREFCGGNKSSEHAWRHSAELKLCGVCAETGISSGILHRRSEDEGSCPACASPINNAEAAGFWDGERAGGRILMATCETCHSLLTKHDGSDESRWQLVG